MDLPPLDSDEYGNKHLQDLVRKVHPADAMAFIRKLTTQPLAARFHTYRELLVGVYLREQGLDVRYEQTVCVQTPDWHLEASGDMHEEIFDVFTLHQRREKDVEITRSIADYGRWSGWITVPPDHVYRKLTDKAGQYNDLVTRCGIPMVLSPFVDFTASIDPEEMQHVLFEQHGGWFATAPSVSGVLYSRMNSFEFQAVYYANPHATLRSVLSSPFSRYNGA
jgi:hypothetical protein